jgi:hypothetical protein
MERLGDRLAQLHGVTCETVEAVEYETPATDSIYAVGTSLRFGDGTLLQAQFWRLTKAGKPLVSIFDHRQRYGLPEPVDAVRVMRSELVGRRILSSRMDETTGDLRFGFDGELALEVFNFTAFEIWELNFPDGAREFSNYALRA